MKKMLMALTTAGVLAVPFGVILAEDEPSEPSDPASTCVEADRVRDRDRLHVDNETPLGEQARECDGDAARTREREQNRLEVEAGAGPMVREREQNRLEEGTGTPAENAIVGADAATTVDGANLQLRYGAGDDRGGR